MKHFPSDFHSYSELFAALPAFLLLLHLPLPAHLQAGCQNLRSGHASGLKLILNLSVVNSSPAP